MANRNPQPLTTLPLPPLAYDVQYQNNLVRLLNNNFNSIKNPGNSQSHSLTITNAPTSPTDPNTGQTLADGTIWNDGGFLKILPQGNPGDIHANTVTANTVTTDLLYANSSFMDNMSVNSVAAGSIVTTTLTALDTVSANSVSAVSFTGGYVDVTGAYYVDSTQVVGPQQPGISYASSPTATTTGTDSKGGAISATTTVDATSLVTAVNQIIVVLQAHGLIAP